MTAWPQSSYINGLQLENPSFVDAFPIQSLHLHREIREIPLLLMFGSAMFRFKLPPFPTLHRSEGLTLEGNPRDVRASLTYTEHCYTTAIRIVYDSL
jgi:hypothetical protein